MHCASAKSGNGPCGESLLVLEGGVGDFASDCISRRCTTGMVSILPNAYAQAQAKLLKDSVVPDQRGTKRPVVALEFEPG